ncbi:hypothetical protein BT63DRAFT_460552 [Microthyrium microscopicum]|uniref:DUF7136 domain-containing protein n=1 Tax=Microthyrium microscopicum TaxID=703497 RepID=A0A6A6TW16_9PEZI|nr:hypothetical protein BT63DRAFT_460552 [Microthyrium microscopicum]
MPIQVDVIFPKNNTVYQPVYPFPFVFAVHNFSTTWIYRPTFTWTLQAWNTHGYPRDVSFGYIGWDTMKGQDSWGPPPDEFVAVNSSASQADDITDPVFVDDLQRNQSNETRWSLAVKIWFNNATCFDQKVLTHRIWFNTSIQAGVMPNLGAVGSCPSVSLATGVQGQSQKNETNEICNIYTNPLDASACAFTMNQQLLDRVPKEMVAVTRCANVSWPNSTGIGTRCVSGKSLSAEGKNASSNTQWNTGSVGISIIAAFIIILYFT